MHGEPKTFYLLATSSTVPRNVTFQRRRVKSSAPLTMDGMDDLDEMDRMDRMDSISHLYCVAWFYTELTIEASPLL